MQVVIRSMKIMTADKLTKNTDKGYSGDNNYIDKFCVYCNHTSLGRNWKISQ